MDDTLVSFASGACEGSSEVLAVHGALGPVASGESLVIVRETPFHPVDHTWPDQPGDTGWCGPAEVVDTVMAAVGPEAQLIIGGDLPVKRGEPGWTWFVAHVLAPGEPSPDVGDPVTLRVDAERRRSLSLAHTACHLAALAMNAATEHLWRKTSRQDSLGSPDLDQLAMQTSAMDVSGSTDVYRLGKSLRKKGFESARLADELESVVATVNAQLAAWIDTDAPVHIVDHGDRRVTAPREWQCALPQGSAHLPCGGTHVGSLGAFDRITVDYALAPDQTQLTVRTVPVAAR